VRTLASAACVLVTLFTASTACAQERSKSEESSRETKEEIKSILSDIESRQPPVAPPVAPPVTQPSEVPTVPERKRVAWQPLLCLGVALVLVGLGLVVFRVLAVKARERRIEDMAEAIRRSRL
jgi:hypothetical protein